MKIIVIGHEELTFIAASVKCRGNEPFCRNHEDEIMKLSAQLRYEGLFCKMPEAT